MSAKTMREEAEAAYPGDDLVNDTLRSIWLAGAAAMQKRAKEAVQGCALSVVPDNPDAIEHIAAAIEAIPLE